MRILVLNGSPRAKGGTAAMVAAFSQGAEEAGHELAVFDVARMKIAGCMACEYCHGPGKGACAQKDDMEQVYAALAEAEMLVLASPIYYHSFTGQLRCAIDRFYAAAYPKRPPRLAKCTIMLCSGDTGVYDGALYSYHGDFTGYLGLEDMGVFCATTGEAKSEQMRTRLIEFGRSL